MTTYTVSTTAALQARLANGAGGTVGGDIIEVAAGKYGLITLNGVSKASPGVTIRPSNRNTPPVWEARSFSLINCDWYTFDGLQFIGTAVEGQYNGQDMPLQDDTWYAESSEHLTLINCTFRFQRNQLKTRSGCNDFLITRCHFSQCGEDNIFCGGTNHRMTISYNQFDDPRINIPLDSTGDRHPDVIQLRCNPGSIDSNPWQDTVIEYNYYNFPDDTGKALYLHNEPPGVGIGFIRPRIFQNQILCGRWSAYNLNGQRDLVYERNRIRNTATKVDEEPRIWVRVAAGPNINCTIKDNVMHRQIQYTGTNASTITSINNVVNPNDNTNPPGWKELVPGLPFASETATKVGVGPYTGSSVIPVPTTPETPDEEWSNPPTNTTSFHGRFGFYGEVLPALTPKRYSALLFIPPASPMFDAAKVGFATPNGLVVNLQWTKDDGVTWKPLRFSVPAINAGNGSVRAETRGDVGDADSVWSMLAGETMSGLKWRWKPDGTAVWSDKSTYSGSVTAPGTPPSPTLPALTDAQWTMLAPVADPAYTNRFVANFTVSGAITYSAVQWTPEGGDGQWRTCVNLSTPASPLWQPQPLTQNGIEHTVLYGETKSFRVRYGDGTNFSSQSVTAKSFTGPAAPDFPVGYDPGKHLVYVGNPIKCGGVPLLIPYPNAPGIIRSDSVYVQRINNDVTVFAPIDMPGGAVGQEVIYGGIHYPIVGGSATFLADPAYTFALVRAYDGGTPRLYGPCLYLFIPGP